MFQSAATTTVKAKKPYISAVKLAEYMTANSTRRRAIVKNLKYAKPYIQNRYSNVRRIVPSYYNSGYDNTIIDAEIAKINSLKKTTQWDKDDHPNSILALKNLKEMDLPDLSKFEFVTDLKKLDHVMLKGLKVTLKPELYLINKKNDKVGAIKTHISKTKSNRLKPKGLEFAATLFKYGFLEQGFDLKEVDNSGCIAIEVFDGMYGNAPSAYKRAITALGVSCEEILLRWPSV